MPACQFGERQYELAANLELLVGSGSFFAPTTSVEAHLAIDVALTPGDPRIWSLLGMSPPRGVAAGQGVFRGWPAGSAGPASPPFLVSLFIQFKRSTYLMRSTAKEWTTHSTPYWRLDLTAHQHRLLQDLEVAVGGDAAVRYAAPKFWQHRDMWRLQGTGGVMDNSLIVAPSAIHSRHRRLTWSHSRGLVGHSDPETFSAETSEDLGREILARVRTRTPERGREDPRAHFTNLATAVAELTPLQRRREQWYDDIAERRELRDLLGDDEMIAPLADIATVAEAAHEARASWLMLAVTERDS